MKCLVRQITQACSDGGLRYSSAINTNFGRIFETISGWENLGLYSRMTIMNEYFPTVCKCMFTVV